MSEATAADTVEILYGTTGLTVRLPGGARATVVRKPTLAKLPDPHAAVRAALAAPVAAKPYADVVRGRRSACILICDVTRPVPNRLFLRPLIETLMAAGIPAAAISVLVA